MSDDSKINATVEDVNDSERLFRHYAPLMIGQGAIGLLAGIVLLFWPIAGLGFVGVILGLFLLTDGIVRLISRLKAKKNESNRGEWWFGVGSILRVVFGLVIIFSPTASGSFLVKLIFILAGLNLVVGTLFRLRSDSNLKSDLLRVFQALIMLAIGLLMILLPMISALALLRVLGIVMVFGSVPTLAIGVRSSR